MKCIWDEIDDARWDDQRRVDGVAWGRCSLAVNLYWSLHSRVWGNIHRDICEEVEEKCGEAR